MQLTLPHNWDPRPYQQRAWEYLRNGGKRAALCWARRHGKDDLSMHFTCIAAHEVVGSYWHLLPEQAQGQKAIWRQVNKHTGKRRIDEAFPTVLRRRTLDDEMFIEFLNGSTWQVVGSDNYNSLVGASPAGLVFSEYARSDPSAWAYLRPILRENNGWAIFISTAYGKNHFYHMLQLAKREPDWFWEVITNDDSHLLTHEALQSELRELQAEHGDSYGKAIWLQEYFCSFDAAIPGAIWAESLDRLQLGGCIREFDLVRESPIFTGWDLGRTDDTAIWFYQFRGHEIDVVDYWADSGCELYDEAAPEKSISHVLLDKIRKYGYKYATHWVPHDARPRRLGMGGKSILQQLQDAAKRHPELGKFAVAPKLDVQEGIQAARKTFQSCRFHATKCELGLQALRHYHREWDAEKKMYLDTPVHDWCLAKGTQVLTAMGWKRVETISVHDRALTPLGSRAILRAGIVRRTTAWTTIQGIRCTPEHRFFTNRGLVEAGALSCHDVLWTQEDWGLRFLASWCAMLRFGFMGAITLATPRMDARQKQACSFIGWSIKLCMAKFQQVTISIIETAIRGITILTTWKPFLASSIAHRTNQSLALHAFARYVDARSAAINPSGERARQTASELGTHAARRSSGLSDALGEPAYNLTVEHDHCYFVKGFDGAAYLVANSSHPADAWRTVALTWKAAQIEAPPDPNAGILVPKPILWGDLTKAHFERMRALREGYL